MMDPLLAGALLVVILALSVWERRRTQEDRAAERKEWETERAELLTRIQHPEVAPLRTPPAWRPEPPKDAAAFAKIGTVARDDGPDR